MENIKRLSEKELDKLTEKLARSNNNRLISNPVSKAHHHSSYVIVWWYNRNTGKLLSVEGRENRHRDLDSFPEIDSDTAWSKGRVLKWNYFYNCVYDLLTVSQLEDLNRKIEEKYKIHIDHNVDNIGDEILI